MSGYEFEAEIWESASDAAWCFVSLPFDVADEIEARDPGGTGFGSVRVEVTCGTTTWRTSVSPTGDEPPTCCR